MLLYRYVSKMNVHVVELLDARIVFDSTKPAETKFEEIGLERAERCNKSVKTKIKLFASNQ